MMRTMGIRMTHVPYRGGAPMTTDLIAGVIPLGIDVLAQADIQKRLPEPGVTATPVTPAAFSAFVRDQVTALQPLVKSIRVTL
jgi:tripartite-type tricarboxylate transporter receptor subunit TctC